LNTRVRARIESNCTGASRRIWIETRRQVLACQAGEMGSAVIERCDQATFLEPIQIWKSIRVGQSHIEPVEPQRNHTIGHMRTLLGISFFR
jgi:hypothetical protein